ncbi:T9SS type A sorting domain-containing protein [Seonamhaeicola maritimus]|uniref:T9SS type A sorting domain-containing protein n=1 Tax=Seonamhaeicola maritimus TaxID=2591822 RepID=UPI00249479DA|nr:T9SS type A sorting domain-containing protein [Seonamhaeicola maritimus]
MKTKLLFTLLLITAFGYSQTYDNSAGYYINELIASISGTDSPDEYIELRGPVSGTLPAGTYFITIEGDGESGNLGEVQEVLDLSGLSFGTNGYMTITFDPNTGDPGIENSYSALLALANSSDYDQTTVTGYDGDLLDYTSTYLLISAPSDPDGLNVDSSPLDGEFDAAGSHTSWNIYDSVSSMDDDGGGANTEYAWAQMNVATNYTTTPTYFDFPSGSSVISCDDDGGSSANVYYIARQGTSTGYDPVSDWMAGQTNSGSVRPNWEFTSREPKCVPDSRAGTTLPDSTFGGPNEDPVDDVLSNEDFIASNFKIYPNPVKNVLTIDSNNIEVSSVKIYNILGKQVFFQKGLTTNELNISHLNSGLYVLRLDTFEGALNKKIVVE